MSPLQSMSLILTLAGFLIAGGCLYLVHCPCRVLAKIGRRLFIGALMMLGVFGTVAAITFHEGLATLGLLGGLIVVAMLWEPAPSENSV